MKSRPRKLRWLAATAVAALALAMIVIDTSAPSLSRTDGSLVPPGTANLRGAIDPETGELTVGSAPQGLSGNQDKAVLGELEKMLSRSDEDLEAVRHPDGRVSVHLDGRFMNASVARINADGEMETVCTEHPDEAHHFLETVTEVDAHGREVR